MEKNSMGFSSLSENKKATPIIINDRFILKDIVFNQANYRLCRAIDNTNYNYVNVFFKPSSAQTSNFLTGIKEDLKKKICPNIIWKGVQKIAKHTYEVEVHQKLGPSIQQIFKNMKVKLSIETIFLLAYQMLKLIEKLALAGYVCRNLNPNTIILNSDPQKIDLFLLNDFDVKKKNEQGSVNNGKYASVGSHLGLKASYKDDLQGLCYILFDLCSNKSFFEGIKQKNLMEFKSTIKISSCDKIPKLILDLFIYARNLNHSQQPNYVQWKTVLKDKIPKSYFNQPYQWILRAKARSKISKNSENSENSESQPPRQQQVTKSSFYAQKIQMKTGKKTPLKNIYTQNIQYREENISQDQFQNIQMEGLEDKLLKRSSDGWNNFANIEQDI